MTLLCSAMLAIAAYTGTIETNWHRSADLSGPSAEVQTCKNGFGVRLAWADDWVQAGPQFGYTWPIGAAWAITTQIHGGLGYSNTHHPDTGIRQITLYNGGIGLLVGYDRYVLKVGYDHMSNGTGLNSRNVGQDQWSMGVGYQF